MLALPAIVLGVVLAVLLLHVIVSTAPPGLPRLDQITLSPGALAAASAISLLALFAAGVLPAATATAPLGESLRSDSRAGIETRARRTMRSALVAGQISLALVLLAGAGLLTRSMMRLEGLDLGYVPAHLSIVQITAPYHKYTRAHQLDDAFDQVQQEFRAVPGVVAVTPVLAWPFQGANVFAARFAVRDRPDLTGTVAPYVSWDAVGQEFSKVMNAPIIRGRGITADDRPGTEPVAVVTQDLANLYWPGRDPLGRQLRFAGDTTWRTVVGVIAPLNYRTMRESTPTVLLSYRQEWQQGILAVRSSRELAAILPELRRAASANDRDIVLWRAETMDQMLAGPLGRPRIEAYLLGLFAGAALLLAAVGLYGVISVLVRQQTREIGIRIALGASAGRMEAIVLGRALRIAFIGVGVGLVISLLAGRLIASELFEVSPSDPVALLAASVLLTLVLVVGAYVPARRAARVDPMVVLRTE